MLGDRSIKVYPPSSLANRSLFAKRILPGRGRGRPDRLGQLAATALLQFSWGNWALAEAAWQISKCVLGLKDISLSSEMKSQPAATASQLYLVRLGAVSQVGRLAVAEPLHLVRGQRVVCRTARGIEVGSVLGEALLGGSGLHPAAEADGRILRRLTAEDELLWGHLQQLGRETFEQCSQWLEENRVAATLLDVEPLLDGQTLYFHFLSAVEPIVQTQLDTLVAVYEQNVRESKFAQLLEHGCGPGCGTAQAKNGCGSKGGCAVCKIASVCKK